MKTIVFGATGYLGSHVAEQLVRAGHEVNCVIRQGSDSRFLETLPVTITRGDFSAVTALADTIDPGSTVVNCVAETRMHLSDAARRVVEIDLTSRIFSAARAAGATRFVQLSTVMIYGFDRPVTAIDEGYPVKPKYGYSRIAREREQALLDLQSGSCVELVILRPSNTLGKRDGSALPALLAAHEKGNFAVIGGGAWKFSCMDARDVGRAMVHLLDVDVTVSKPEIFLAKGYDISWLDVKAALDKILGRQTRLVNIPKGLAMGLGWLMESLYPYGKNPPLTRFSVEVLSNHTLFDDGKIRRSGFQPGSDLAATLRDALERPEH
ncbi:MAG: NAD-dependent epimerase/dehydratase family protein [Porticoccaceae bacterium]